MDNRPFYFYTYSAICQYDFHMFETPTLREQKKARNRELLLEATANVIAAHGIAGASITRIIEHAGLSRGMVHLHFANKEALLVAVAAHMREQYFHHMDEFLTATSPLPQHQLEAIISAELSNQILNRRSINIWYAFRGQCHQESSYMQYADTRDEAMKDKVYQSFLQLLNQPVRRQEEKQDICSDATYGLLALLEGMWSDYFLHSDEFNRQSAKRIIFRQLSGLFPDHFQLTGAM
jgi:TetR/AcrR family transcriptional repressor of bet genes